MSFCKQIEKTLKIKIEDYEEDDWDNYEGLDYEEEEEDTENVTRTIAYSGDSVQICVDNNNNGWSYHTIDTGLSYYSGPATITCHTIASE